MEFRLIEANEFNSVFNWHRGFAASNEFIFPRTSEQYLRIIDNNQAWCAYDHTGNYVGIAYSNFDGKEEWELGGLMVSARERGKGIASTLMRLALGHTLFTEDPLADGHRVVAHVHEDNKDPRALITGVLKFTRNKTVTIPGSALPGLKTNAEGNVVGEEYHLHRPNSLNALADWCESWRGSLRGGQQVQITLSPETNLAMWADAFREMAMRDQIRQVT